MMAEEEARAAILARVPPLVEERVVLGEALERFSAVAVTASVALPGFDNSAMDGYAVRAREAGEGARLKVVGEQPAGGDLGLSIGAGEALRVFTGAPLPAGADAVVMQEDCERSGEFVRIGAAARAGEFVRRRGSDLCEGQQLLAAGERFSPQRIGLLASQGVAQVVVGRRPRVGILSTGDELVAPESGRPLRAGEIYDSNGPMLEAAVRRVLGLGARVERQRSGDDERALAGTLRALLDTCDVLVIAGGVSVGERDLVKESLEGCGVETGFWRVRLKPGKPFLFGVREACGTAPGGTKLVFGLPGNPVSAFVTFTVFVAPALRRWCGAGDDELLPAAVRARLVEAVDNPGDRPHYVRGVLERGGHFRAVGVQQSHALAGLARADGLLRVGAGASLEAGVEVEVIPVA